MSCCAALTSGSSRSSSSSSSGSSDSGGKEAQKYGLKETLEIQILAQTHKLVCELYFLSAFSLLLYFKLDT